MRLRTLILTITLAVSTSGCFIIIDNDEDASSDATDTTDARSDTTDDVTDASDIQPDTRPDRCADPATRAPIVGVDLSSAIFLGRPALAAADRPTSPTEVRSLREYRARFAFDADSTGRADGSLDAGSFVASGDNALAWSVHMFFTNGGKRATVIPTAGDVPSDADLAQLDALDGGLLVVPGLAEAGERERRDGFGRIEVALNAPENDDVFFVGNPPAGASTADLSAANPPPYVGFRDDRAALYVPWLEVTSAADASTSIDIPPAGAVAGIYARVDSMRGIWKAPAGRSADISGIQALAQTIPDADLDTWNQAQVNPLRVTEGGSVVWGARTRQADNPDWTFVATRRLGTYIEKSIRQGTDWARFDSNDATLWAKLAADSENFLNGLLRQGGLQGERPEQAYFVRVDQTTTTADDIAAGVAVIQLGFAPLRPEEFIVLRIEVPAGVCL